MNPSTSATTAPAPIIATASAHQCEVALVGCGLPGRGMGWYHAEQLLKGQCPSAQLCYIVEPWFLGPGADSPAGREFHAYKTKVEAAHGVQFGTCLADWPTNKKTESSLSPTALADPVHSQSQPPRLALISGRTADNPRLLQEAIQAGCSTIYLEKPGAPTVTELEHMRDISRQANVTVLMGYNKNVSRYVSQARTYQAKHGGHLTFVSNNSYANTPESLGECFERNAEGMLKNMAIHELALLVSFFDVTVETIAQCVPDKAFSSCQTLTGPHSQKDFTDFDKIKFTITTTTGKEVSVQADRCGGSTSYAKVEVNGSEVFRHEMPDADDLAHVAMLEKEYPGAMPYFFVQDPDYITVKERVANFCANGVEAKGVADIDIAVETMRVAEYLTPIIQKALLEDKEA